jgi:uncharacterized tellurite resistance protein B-like protein
MGLLQRMEEERRKHMERITLELSAPEAAVALAALVSFCDDNPSEAEGVILRKYYRFATAQSLQDKLERAGYGYPTDLPAAEETIVRAIASAPRAFKIRTLAVAWTLALADGHVDQHELRLLSRYAEALGVGLAEARLVAEAGLPEIDELVEDELETVGPSAGDDQASQINPALLPELSPVEAGIALACWAGFADDDPSDAEAAVVRDHFRANEVEQFITMLGEHGYAYPQMLPALEPAILRTLRRLCRDEQVRLLAISHRVAVADNQVSTEELSIIKRYCEELAIGLAEVTSYFRSSIG